MGDMRDRVDMGDETSVAGGRFLRAFLARDFDGIATAVAPDARFRYLIPAGPREHASEAGLPFWRRGSAAPESSAC
jgi:hypothetical protein